ncbi:hypothetical protein QAD02_007726 [Eretmocerus hayati]|uniref:Uncharacterized protein n=1 Tax=Eretmocerus hayati TaxID=131215 RepID=A0ACC2N6W2_9HYME|nr:hypothetical protein QAD02_007726 [Eretmocerus hayati]
MLIRLLLVTVFLLSSMGPIICFKCLGKFDGSQNFKSHFQRIHTNDLKNSTNFPRKQGNCRVSRNSSSSLIHHITISHVILPQKRTSTSLPNHVEKRKSVRLDHANAVDNTSTIKTSPLDRTNDEFRQKSCDSVNKDDSDTIRVDDEIDSLRKSVEDGANKWITSLKLSMLTSANLTKVAESTKDFLSKISDASKVTLTNFLKSINVDFTPDVINFVDNFRFDGSVGRLKSQKRQDQAVQESHKYIPPKGIPLGYRLERRFDKKLQRPVYVKIYEKFQHVSIIEILKLIISHDIIREHIDSEAKSSDGYMHNFRDALSFALNEFFKKFPNALRLQIYFDDVVVNNKLGTKVPQHKLCMFYFVIQNLPKYLNSLLGGIHEFGIGYTSDINKYGFEKVLQPFMSDLRQLESDEGILVKLKSGEDYVLRATIASVSADTLAAHQLFGLLSPGRALHFCRCCMIDRNEFYRDINYFVEKRKEFGLEQDSALHKSKYWHFTRDWSFDPMHDIFEGNGELTLKLVIHHFINNEKYNLTVQKLNDRIDHFDYGSTDVKDKPSGCFTTPQLNNLEDHKIRQTAAQTWCLMRIFPFSLSDIVDEHNEHLQLVILLNKITEIVLSPKTSTSILPYLEMLIYDFNAFFVKLFPGVDPINKLHHWLHYCACILFSGPMEPMCCFRIEAKHREFTKYGSICQNYKNLPLSMINRAQTKQAAIWGDRISHLKPSIIQGPKERLF